MPSRARLRLWAQVPPALRDVILDFRWDHARLHTLDLPVHTVAHAGLAWLLDLPFWSARGVSRRSSRVY
ncbi:hypothetical protein [Mycobacteroides franklinii]|uniref:Uncharacterized protein n=1 Tax=Mycobacteroides franklinii TaxID=948102 RepID=A0A4R5P8L8_9MYCO|nr:hypothetical protein [Mycobacteroides franklinii]TDH20132.1 hypothetical protein EJ571_15135 [Mycobacteroides franklinii]